MSSKLIVVREIEYEPNSAAEWLDTLYMCPKCYKAFPSVSDIRRRACLHCGEEFDGLKAYKIEASPAPKL